MTTTVAQCAAAIRKDLKQAFPGVKFSVRSSSYSMGDSVSIRYVDGVLVNDVNKVVDKYEYGSFNGMEDIYEINNSNSDIPQTKFIIIQREMSEEAKRLIATKLSIKFNICTFEEFMKNDAIRANGHLFYPCDERLKEFGKIRF